MPPQLAAWSRHEVELRALTAPLALGEMVEGDGPWEVELGFGKGRYLLQHATARPACRYLGVEVASRYYRLVRRRMMHRRLSNVVLLRGEALYLLTTALPAAFAAAVHVYFPDPWPKSRHQKRRLFDADTVDLVLGLLSPGGRLSFATDALDYGEQVAELLASYPGVELVHLDRWPEGPRTNYEAKYERVGRPILRLEATSRAPLDLHPAGRPAIVAAPQPPPDPDCEETG